MSGAHLGGEILADGPIHKLIVEFELNRFRGELLPELERLKEQGIIRVLDLIAVRKDRMGAFAVLSMSDLSPEEAVEFGAAVGSLIGLGVAGREGAEIGAVVGAEALEDGHLFDPRDAPRLAERMPNATTYVIALFEHLWSIPLREKIDRAGGSIITEEWVGISELISIGLGASSTPLGLVADTVAEQVADSQEAETGT
jgi:hypothetical protein